MQLPAETLRSLLLRRTEDFLPLVTIGDTAQAGSLADQAGLGDATQSPPKPAQLALTPTSRLLPPHDLHVKLCLEGVHPATVQHPVRD